MLNIILYICLIWYIHVYYLYILNSFLTDLCQYVNMYELMDFQPSLLIFCLVACCVVIYTCNYYMILLHIILRWGGVIGPNSGLTPNVLPV